MSWMNVPFPPRLAFGIECDPEWQSTIATTISGNESRNLNWSNARHSYDASFAVRSDVDHALIRKHFHMARGRFHSFPLTDPLDSQVALTEGVVGPLAAADTFQLAKRYGSGSFAYDRKVTRPTSVLLYRSGVAKVQGTDYTLDLADGLGVVHYPGATADQLTWTGAFNVPVRYDTTKLPVRIVNRNGAHGALLIASESIPIVEVRE